MAGVQVRRIDPRDEAAFDAWFEVLHVTDVERWPDGGSGWQRVERLAMALNEDGPEEHRLLVATTTGDGGGDGGAGAVVGIGDVELFRRENLHVARLEVRVLPDARRQGVGRAIVEVAEAMARQGGRSELCGMDDTPLRAGHVDTAKPFAESLGFAVAQRMERRRLSVPLPPAQLAALEQDPRARPAGYSLITFGDRWPDEYLADRCELGRRMSTDVPTGEQELDEEVWDGVRVRQVEAALAAQDRAKVTTAACHDDSGRLVAFTEVVIPRGASSSAWQHDTLVMREHRGHGLGFAMKVANFVAVTRAHPEVRSISTWNAAENAHMIAVNDDMGFKVVSRAAYWQKRLDAP